MTQMSQRSSRDDVFASAVVALLMAVFLFASLQLGGRSGQFPTVIASAGLVIALVDLALSFRKLLVAEEKPGAARLLTGFEFAAMFWPPFMIFLIFLFGFYIAVPVFMFAFLSVGPEKVSLQMRLSVVIVFSAISFSVFVWLLGVRAFPGLIPELFL